MPSPDDDLKPNDDLELDDDLKPNDDQKLDASTVDRIAALAHLTLSDEERVLYARQLGEILAYAEEVQRVDTTGVLPTSHALAPVDSVREDVHRAGLPRDLALKNAPDADREAGLFRVPRVIGS